jgi:ribosomal-protein-alanine N-acetyltransferase
MFNRRPTTRGRESTYYITSARVSDPFRRLAALTGLLAASLLHDLSDLIPATSTPTRLPSMAMIPTQRLAMTPMSCEAMRAIMAADWQRAEGLLGTPFPTEWRNDGWGWLAPRVVEGDLDARLLVWGTRLARLIDGRGQAVAEVGFHGPPDDDGWVEIGYRVVTGYRRRGFAEEACRGLLDWAFTQGVDGVRAAISPDNEASARLAQKLGFAHAGRARHEVLGEQLIFEHPRGSYGCLG